jgi:hypothetical protein
VHLTIAWMVYVEVVLRIQVDWRTILASWGGNVPPYQPNIFVMVANPSILPKTPSVLITFPLVRQAWPQVLPKLPFIIRLFFPTSTTNTNCSQINNTY